MQELITGLARNTSHVERHGEVMQILAHDGATLYGGYYMATRLYEVVFADGQHMAFHMVAGKPVQASEWRTKR